MNDAAQASATDLRSDVVRVLTALELTDIGGGYPCSYLGVEDWTRMMSYESRNYSC